MSVGSANACPHYYRVYTYTVNVLYLISSKISQVWVMPFEMQTICKITLYLVS